MRGAPHFFPARSPFPHPLGHLGQRPALAFAPHEREAVPLFNPALKLGFVVWDVDRLWQVEGAKVLLSSGEPLAKLIVLSRKSLIGLAVTFGERSILSRLSRPVHGESSFE